MKLYMHPVSNTSRPVLLFIAENNLPVDHEMVDLMTGAHHQEPFISVNPNRLVPVLDDDGFILTESAAILKYLADKFDLPAYPKDLKQRAKVNEMMDWFNTNLYRDLAYGLVYPQVFPHHRRPSDESQNATIAWGREGAKRWLAVLNDHWLGAGQPYLCGDRITIADYFGAGLLTSGELVGCRFDDYPNIARWLANMKALPRWTEVNQTFDGLRAALSGQALQAL
jgi:glutathione S-transferase